MPWRELLLDSHSIAIASAAGVALLAFPGAEFAESAQPALGFFAAKTPTAQSDFVLPKGPGVRHSGASLAIDDEPIAPAVPEQIEADPAPAMHPVSHRPTAERAKSAAPTVRLQRVFEPCFHAQDKLACRRAFEAAVERHGGFQRVAGGRPLGTQPVSALPESMPALHFEEAPAWQRRLEHVAEHGILFKRMKRGPDHELLIGLTRHGVLGFSLEERSSGD